LMKEDYPSFLTRESKPFDPIRLAHQTEEIISKGRSRKYTKFYCAGVYGGISTGYTIVPLQTGQFFAPQEVFENLVSNARKKGVNKIRISGGEPTLCPEHLLSLLDHLDSVPFLFILETNGMLFGHDPDYVKRLKAHRNIHIRVSLKAGSPEGFEKRTGARGEFYELPFKAVEYLNRAGVSFHVAAMTDSRLMLPTERKMLLSLLESVGYQDYLEEEICDPYSTAVKRLEKAGFKIW